MIASPPPSKGSDPPSGNGAGSIGLDEDDVDGGTDIALVAGEERASSMALVSSNSASDLRFAPVPKSIPFFARTSLNEVGFRGCMLVTRSLGVEASAAPLLAEPAGEGGPEAIRNCTGCIGTGGRLVAVRTATVSCGVV